MARKSIVMSAVREVLAEYHGHYIHVTALLYELNGSKRCITRETARKWLLRYGCKGMGGGIYKVPATLKEVQ